MHTQTAGQFFSSFFFNSTKHVFQQLDSTLIHRHQLFSAFHINRSIQEWRQNRLNHHHHHHHHFTGVQSFRESVKHKATTQSLPVTQWRTRNRTRNRRRRRLKRRGTSNDVKDGQREKETEFLRSLGLSLNQRLLKPRCVLECAMITKRRKKEQVIESTGGGDDQSQDQSSASYCRRCSCW